MTTGILLLLLEPVTAGLVVGAAVLRHVPIVHLVGHLLVVPNKIDK